MSPKLFIIAGCNGAGKTTASYYILPELLGCREFVNADEIARVLSPFNPESVAIEAGKLMLRRINLLMEERKNIRYLNHSGNQILREYCQESQSAGIYCNSAFLLASLS